MSKLFWCRLYLWEFQVDLKISTRSENKKMIALTKPHIFWYLRLSQSKSLITSSIVWLLIVMIAYHETVFVGCLVELVEKEEEHHSMHSDPPNKCLRIIAIDEEQLEGVHHDQYELNLQLGLIIGINNWMLIENLWTCHLQRCQVLLPPKILLILWTHGREHVVRVHHNVHKGIEQAKESAVSTWKNIRRYETKIRRFARQSVKI